MSDHHIPLTQEEQDTSLPVQTSFRSWPNLKLIPPAVTGLMIVLSIADKDLAFLGPFINVGAGLSLLGLVFQMAEWLGAREWRFIRKTHAGVEELEKNDGH